MWGEQNLLRKRDELVQKLRGIMPTPTAEIDELRSCKGKKLKHLINEIEKLYNEVLLPISIKTKTIASQANEKNRLQEQHNEIEDAKDQVIQDIDNCDDGSRERTKQIGVLQSLINKGKSLPAQMAVYDKSIKAESDAKIALEIVCIKKRIMRTVKPEEAQRIDAMIAEIEDADKSLEKIRADLAEFANEVTQVADSESPNYEAEKLLAERRRAKQATIVPKKPQTIRTGTMAKTNPLPLAEEEY